MPPGGSTTKVHRPRMNKDLSRRSKERSRVLSISPPPARSGSMPRTWFLWNRNALVHHRTLPVKGRSDVANPSGPLLCTPQHIPYFHTSCTQCSRQCRQLRLLITLGLHPDIPLVRGRASVGLRHVSTSATCFIWSLQRPSLHFQTGIILCAVKFGTDLIPSSIYCKWA